jgi:putative FmdB family regulatory protein
MPTYEYACPSCGTHVEVYQRFSESPLTVCSVCGGPLRKVFHPAGILFKGSGFYATDSRASRSRSSGDGESLSSSSSSAKDGKPEKAATGAKSEGGSAKDPSGGASGSGGQKEKSA